MKMQRITQVIILIVIACLLINYKTIGSKWKGIHPIIKFEINPFFIGYKSFLNTKGIAYRMIQAAEEWNTKSNSRIEWQAVGIQKLTEIQPANFDIKSMQTLATEKGMSICDLAKVNASKSNVIFFNQQLEDSDCTSSSCAYVWTCGDEIVSANVVFNNFDFNWNDLANDKDMIDIKSETMKIFGFITGLSSCKAGDATLCNDPNEPDISSAVYRFTQQGQKQTISQDDINGIQYLYGQYQLPFPTTGEYALNFTERNTLRDLRRLEESTGYDSPLKRMEQAKFTKALIGYNENKEKKTFREMYDAFINKMERQMGGASVDALLLQRDTLLTGIYQAYRTKEDVQNGYSTMDIGFIDYTIGRQLSLWNKTIDALGSNRK